MGKWGAVKGVMKVRKLSKGTSHTECRDGVAEERRNEERRLTDGAD